MFDFSVPNDGLAAKIVGNMYKHDAFSQWLGIQVLDTGPGCCVLQMTVRSDMLNGFGIAHGGITYSLADSALAFASNSHGRQTVSIETSISHTCKIKEGDVLTAVAHEENLGNTIGIYAIEIRNTEGKIAALFKGTVFRMKDISLDQ